MKANCVRKCSFTGRLLRPRDRGGRLQDSYPANDMSGLYRNRRANRDLVLNESASIVNRDRWLIIVKVR